MLKLTNIVQLYTEQIIREVYNNNDTKKRTQVYGFKYAKKRNGRRLLWLNGIVLSFEWDMTTLVSQEPGLATIPESPTGENHALPRQPSAAAAAT